jgi:lipopolysaccharide transport system ATP-binding protein
MKALQIENVSKQYRLGAVGSATLREDFARWWYKTMQKEDPFLKKGEVNERNKKGKSDYVWALNEVCFEVRQGEVLGIIGRNGAGKSTLLKLLSKVTAPTTGSIKLNGRVASLLEVGTGFHPELTGRENIFLNGAILGMRRQEIISKFEEIVSFAGVERYIDTPVKRYSSGMYVRLAFAVAAHLDPEILIIDEVLAVGDSEFQKKCVERMRKASDAEGKTILFVTHNLALLKNLCSRSILLQNGRLVDNGPTEVVIMKYFDILSEGVKINQIEGNGKVRLQKMDILNHFGEKSITLCLGKACTFKLIYQVYEPLENVSIALAFNDREDNRRISYWSEFQHKLVSLPMGLVEVVFEIPSMKMIPGDYTIVTYCASKGIVFEEFKGAQNIIVVPDEIVSGFAVPSRNQGLFIDDFTLTIHHK